MEKVVMYGAGWCGDCRRSKRLLERVGVTYEWVDVDTDDRGRQRMLQINGELNKVPTILLPGGVVLVEPSDPELRNALVSAGMI